MRPTRNLSRLFSPAVFKAEIKLSGERVAARFACGAESLAVYRAVYKCIASRCRRGATTSYEGKISTATCTSDYVNLLACWSRYFPDSVPDGYIGVGYSLFYYLLLILGRHGSDSLCRERENKIQCISVQTLIFRLVKHFIRPKTLRSALWRCPILR